MPNPIEYYRGVRQKVRPIEYLHHVTERVNPEGWTAATATDIASWAVLPTAQALIAINVNTGLNIMDPKIAAAAGTATLVSIAADRYALSKRGWDISIVGCVAQAITGRPTLSAILEHTINYVGPLNVVNIAALTTGNFSLLSENIMAAPFVLTPWYITMNLMIGHGTADRVINPIKKAREATWGKFKQKIRK